MNEEKEKTAGLPQEPSAPQAKDTTPEAPPASPQTPPKEAPVPAAPLAKKEEPKKEKPSKCANCSKAIRRKQYYYRNGKHYCTKRCWKSTLKKAEKPAEG